MGHKTYSRTSPTDGRRATLGANGKYSRKNNKGWLINQGIGNLLGTTGEVQITNNNTGTTIDSNTGNGGFDTGGTNDYNTRTDDSNNDGYGEVTRLGSTTTVNSFNIMGEFTVDESQFGTFQTASGYTAYNVRDMNARQPSDIGVQSFFSQNGLADGLNGYVKYREGYDDRVMKFGRDFDALSLPVDDIDGSNGSKTVVADFMEADNAKKIENWDDVIYLDSSKTDITVGDSIYADAEGTMLASGTTNGRKNREWFLWTDGDVVKVTAGVVTHKYNYKDQEDEKWSQYIGTPALSRQTYDGTTVTTDNESITGIGKAWQGDFDSGSLVTTATIDDVATQLQTAFNNGFAIVETTYNPSKRYNYIDNSISDPTAVGEYLYKRIDGFNAGRRLSSDLEVNQREHIYNVLGTTVDESYRFGETYFAYLPVFGFMTRNFNFPSDRGAIIIEYDKYTGQILNRKTVYKNNN